MTRRLGKVAVRLGWFKACRTVAALRAVLDCIENPDPLPYADWAEIARRLRKIEKALSVGTDRALREAIPAAFPEPPP